MATGRASVRRVEILGWRRAVTAIGLAMVVVGVVVLVGAGVRARSRAAAVEAGRERADGKAEAADATAGSSSSLHRRIEMPELGPRAHYWDLHNFCLSYPTPGAADGDADDPASAEGSAAEDQPGRAATTAAALRDAGDDGDGDGDASAADGPAAAADGSYGDHAPIITVYGAPSRGLWTTHRFRTYAGEPTNFIRSVRTVRTTTRVLPTGVGAEPACWMAGTTVFAEDADEAVGERARFLGSILKFFAFVGQAIGDSVVERVWLLSARSPHLVSQWDRQILRLALAGTSKGGAGLPPLLSNTYLAESLCPSVCFERGLFPGVEHALVMAPAHADLVRRRLHDHCGIEPRGVGANAFVFMHAKDDDGDRVLNTKAIYNEVHQQGLALAPSPPAKGDLCDYVRAFERADVILATYGPVLANLLAVQPGSVVIELVPTGRHWPYYKILGDHARLHYLELPSPTVPREDRLGIEDVVVNVTEFAGYLSYARQLWHADGRPLDWCMHRQPITDRQRVFHEMNRILCVPPRTVPPASARQANS